MTQVELSVLSELSHSKIVRLLGVCTSPHTMVLEYYSMGSLDDLLHRERMQLSVGHCLSIALDIALGMVYLHHKKVLHRDIKSQNILVDAGLQARVADFGLAKYPFAGESSEDGITGTVPYMAPEILSRRPYGFPVDVYAYAVVLNEMTSMERPYDGNTPEYVMSAVLNADARPRTRDTSPILSNLTRLCWRKDPRERPTFKDVEAYLKQGMAAAANAQHLSNTLASSVAQLVADMRSSYSVGREDSMGKLRDMLDPGQDLYKVSDVQEAVRLSSGIQATVELLDTRQSHEMPSLPGAPSLHDTHVLAAEILGNAVAGNSNCQDEAGSCGAPRLLVRMLKNGASGAACRAAARSLLVMCEQHKSNSAQASAEGACSALLALALRCAPNCPFDTERVHGANASSDSKDMNGSSGTGRGDQRHVDQESSTTIPGLQHDESTEDTLPGRGVGASDPASDLRKQLKVLMMGTDLCVDRDRTNGEDAEQSPNFDKQIADAEAILGANHSVLDVATPKNARQSGSSWLDTNVPTPQEVQRQQEVRSL